MWGHLGGIVGACGWASAIAAKYIKFFEAELGTGHIQQVFQGFDCPISLKSIFCSHQDTFESAQW